MPSEGLPSCTKLITNIISWKTIIFSKLAESQIVYLSNEKYFYHQEFWVLEALYIHNDMETLLPRAQTLLKIVFSFFSII